MLLRASFAADPARRLAYVLSDTASVLSAASSSVPARLPAASRRGVGTNAVVLNLLAWKRLRQTTSQRRVLYTSAPQRSASPPTTTCVMPWTAGEGRRLCLAEGGAPTCQPYQRIWQPPGLRRLGDWRLLDVVLRWLLFVTSAGQYNTTPCGRAHWAEGGGAWATQRIRPRTPICACFISYVVLRSKAQGNNIGAKTASRHRAA
jgi:hypothetical protein